MTFTVRYTVQRHNLLQRLHNIVNPPLFQIQEDQFNTLLAPHHREPARALLQTSKLPTFNGSRPIHLYYPGCGQDLVWPLLMLNNIARRAHSWTITCQDPMYSFGALVATCQALTGQHVTTLFSRKKEVMTGARFSFRNKTITILYFPTDALQQIPHTLNQGYDIYLERGFDICRKDQPGFLDEAMSNLRPNGLAITDQAFRHIPHGLQQLNHRCTDWGFYKEPRIYLKRSPRIK